MSDEETVEVKVELDPLGADAVAKTEDVVKRVRANAERFQRYAQKKVQRFDREISAVNQKLGSALSRALKIELPRDWRAWTRPDGSAELIYRVPKLKPVEGDSKPTTEPKPVEGDKLAEITPMPAATNGAAK